MKVRIKFSKQGPVKFIGHLDIMRYFQKAMRRADVDIKYSEGFSPHQIMSFAAPLGLGLTSNGEYMDIELKSDVDLEDLKNRLNQVMVEGIRILECKRLDDHAGNAMSMVAAADYTLRFREGRRPENQQEFFEGLLTFVNQEHIPFIKKTKKGEREVDLKSSIYQLAVDGDTIFMRVSAGSSENIKPELVMEAYYQSRGEALPELAFQIQREEVYGNGGAGEELQLLPLGCIGEAVE